MISLTNVNTVLLWRRKYIRALEQLQRKFSDIGTRRYFGQADIFMPELKELWSQGPSMYTFSMSKQFLWAETI